MCLLCYSKIHLQEPQQAPENCYTEGSDYNSIIWYAVTAKIRDPGILVLKKNKHMFAAQIDIPVRTSRLLRHTKDS